MLSFSSWWFQIFSIFIPTWGNDPIWRAYFSNGLGVFWTWRSENFAPSNMKIGESPSCREDHPLEKRKLRSGKKQARFGLLGRETTGIYFVGWLSYTESKPWDKATILVTRKIWGMCFLSNQQTEKSKLLVYVYLLSLIWSQYKKEKNPRPTTPPARPMNASVPNARNVDEKLQRRSGGFVGRGRIPEEQMVEK